MLRNVLPEGGVELVVVVVGVEDWVGVVVT